MFALALVDANIIIHCSNDQNSSLLMTQWISIMYSFLCDFLQQLSGLGVFPLCFSWANWGICS